MLRAQRLFRSIAPIGLQSTLLRRATTANSSQYRILQRPPISLSAVLNRMLSTDTEAPQLQPKRQTAPQHTQQQQQQQQTRVLDFPQDATPAASDVVPAVDEPVESARASASQPEAEPSAAEAPPFNSAAADSAQIWARVQTLLSSENVMQRREGRDMFELMVKPHATDAQWRVVFEHLAKISHVDTLFRYVEEIAGSMLPETAQLTLPTFNVLMNAFGAAGNQRRALWLAEYMKHCQVMCDETTIVGLMRAYAWHVDTANVLKWFEYLLELGIKPTVMSYNVLLKAFARKGDADTALSFYDHMKAAAVTPDSYTFNTLFMICSKSGRYKLVGRLYRDMLSYEIPLDVHMTTSLISLFGKRGDIEAVARWYDRAVIEPRRSDRVKPTRVLFGAVLHAFARAKHPEGLMYYYQQMRKMDESADLNTYKQMILPWLWGPEPSPADAAATRVYRKARAAQGQLPSFSGSRSGEREQRKWHMGTDLTPNQRVAFKEFVAAMKNWLQVRKETTAAADAETARKLAEQAAIEQAAETAEFERRARQSAAQLEANISPELKAEREYEKRELAAEMAEHEKMIQHAMYPDAVATQIANQTAPQRGRRARPLH